MTYFISGHRDITEEEFNRLYKPSIESKVMSLSDVKFIVGDYYGVDAMAQKLLADLHFYNVTVYHMFTSPRNYVSDKFKTKGGYQSDEERDAAMTAESDADIAFVRKGKRKSGTAQNIVRRYEFE